MSCLWFITNDAIFIIAFYFNSVACYVSIFSLRKYRILFSGSCVRRSWSQTGFWDSIQRILHHLVVGASSSIFSARHCLCRRIRVSVLLIIRVCFIPCLSRFTSVGPCSFKLRLEGSISYGCLLYYYYYYFSDLVLSYLSAWPMR